MNLIPMRFEKAAARLDELRGLVAPFCRREAASNGHGKTRGDSGGPLMEDFNRHMNDDLDVRSAIDSLFRNLERFEASRQAGTLGEREKDRIGCELLNIDEVLGVILNASRSH
jgi:hypothetical protein